LHFEEDIENLVVGDVVGQIDGDFFDTTANNVSGTYASPKNVALSNYSITQTGARDHTGVRLTFDANPISPADFVVISNGVLEYFEYGIVIGCKRGDAIRVSDQILRECGYGLYFCDGGFPNCSGITFDTCSVGVYAARGGVLRSPTFIDCTQTHEVASGRLTMVDAIFNLGSVSLASGTSTYFRLLRDITRAQCEVTLDVHEDGTDYSLVIYSVAYDGSTETVSALQTENAGGIQSVVHLIDEITSATIAVAGSGYVVDDILTVSGGTNEASGSDATFRVTSIDGSGGVTGVALENDGGEYTAIPSSPASTTGGTGTGCTLTLSSQKTLAARVFSNATRSDVRLVAEASGKVVVR